MKNSNLLKLSIFLLLIASVFQSCKKDELPELEFFSAKIGDTFFESADIDVIQTDDIMAIAISNSLGQIINIQLNNVTKGDHSITEDGYPFVTAMIDGDSYRSITGNFRIDEVNNENSYILGSMEVTLVQENNSNSSNLTITDAEFYIFF